MSSRRSVRESHWRGVVQRQSESGLTIAAFCRQQSISAPSLYAWKRKFKDRDSRPVESGPRDSAANSCGQLVPVQIESSVPVASVRIVLPQGAWIDTPSNIDRQALVNVLESLREARLC